MITQDRSLELLALFTQLSDYMRDNPEITLYQVVTFCAGDGTDPDRLTDTFIAKVLELQNREVHA